MQMLTSTGMFTQMLEFQAAYFQGFNKLLESRRTRELFYPWNWPALVNRQLDTYNMLYGPIESPAWATPNSVALEYPNVSSPIMRLRVFSNETSDPNKVLLVVSPNAGHASTIIDYKAGQSLVAAGLKEGYSVYGTEWVPPTAATKDTTIDDYVEALEAALDLVTENGNKEAVLEGNCQGGWLSTIVAARNNKKIRHLILAGAPIDFLAGDGPIKQYAQLFPMLFYDWMVEMGNGLMPGQFMLLGFQELDPVEQFIRKPFEVFEKLSDPAFAERTAHYEKWWRTTQNLPGPYYLRTVNDLFKNNRLVKGELLIKTQRDLAEKVVDVSRIDCPVTLVWGTKDIITTWEQMVGIRRYVGTPQDEIVEIILKDRGHIGTFMSGEATEKIYPLIFKRAAVPSTRRCKVPIVVGGVPLPYGVPAHIAEIAETVITDSEDRRPIVTPGEVLRKIITEQAGASETEWAEVGPIVEAM